MTTQPETRENLKTHSLLQPLDAQTPAPDDAFLAALRQSSAAAFSQPATEPSPSRSTRLRLLTWLAPLAALFLIAMAIAFWPGGATQALAWPQVKAQLQLAQALEFTYQETSNGTPGERYRISFLAPDRIRIDQLFQDPANPSELVMISQGGKTLRLNSDTKLFVVEKTKRRNEKANQDTLAALASIGAAANTSLLGTLENPQLQLRPTSQPSLGGAKRDRNEKYMRLVRATPTGDLPFMDNAELTLIFNNQNQLHSLYAISTKHKDKSYSAIITFNLTPKLPAILFDLKGPPGYTDVEHGIFPRLPAELKPIADAYYKARQRLTHYRLAVIPGNDGQPQVNVRYRQVRDGDLWRLDEPDLFAMTGKKQFYFSNPAQTSFDAVWAVMGKPDFPCDSFVLTYKGNLAQGSFFEKNPTSGWLVPPFSVEISDEADEELTKRKNRRWYDQAPTNMFSGSLARYDLRELAWPSFVGDRLLSPFGWNVDAPPPVYCLLTPRADRPGLVGVRAVSECELTEYWIDPTRDFLCIYHTQYFDKLEPWKPSPQAFDAITYYANVKRKPSEPLPSIYPQRQIKETAQTADGRWYPKSFTDGTFVFLDTKGPIDPAFFVWPSHIPEPGTGKGLIEAGPVYTVGTPEANERQARQLTGWRLNDIKHAIERYRSDNNDTWPDSLDQLVHLTYLKPEQIISPRRAPSPFVYIKPIAFDKAERNDRLLLHEPVNPWPTGLNDDLPPGLYTMCTFTGYIHPRFLKTRKEFDALNPK